MSESHSSCIAIIHKVIRAGKAAEERGRELCPEYLCDVPPHQTYVAFLSIFIAVVLRVLLSSLEPFIAHYACLHRPHLYSTPTFGYSILRPSSGSHRHYHTQKLLNHSLSSLSTSSASVTVTPAPIAGSKKKTSASAIVGEILGALAIIAIIVGLCVYKIKEWNKTRQKPARADARLEDRTSSTHALPGVNSKDDK